jgi:cyclophilin family peptidyl-prolyl cis-trans isomerase/HEAT repeat protein
VRRLLVYDSLADLIHRLRGLRGAKPEPKQFHAKPQRSKDAKHIHFPTLRLCLLAPLRETLARRSLMDPIVAIVRSSVGVLTLSALVFLPGATVFSQNRARTLQNPHSGPSVPEKLLIRILRAEDERRWDNDLRSLFSDQRVSVRRRAALAAGRIGAEDSVADLINLLGQDGDPDVGAMAAFAIGETESALGANALLATLKDTNESHLRARAVEALGKIAAALPKEQEALARELGGAILEALSFEARRRSAPNRLTILLGLTATLRAKPANAGPIITEFLTYSDPRIRADAANALARLKLKDGNEQLRKLLLSDPDPIVRANAARVLGATEDKASFDMLLDRALKDTDTRVRVSAIRSLGALKDSRAGKPLVDYGNKVLNEKSPSRTNEMLEVATTIGRIFQGIPDDQATTWLLAVRDNVGRVAPEVEIALVRISARNYLLDLAKGASAKRRAQETILTNWRAASSLAQALGEIAALPDAEKDKKALSGQAEELLRAVLDYRNSGITINTLVAVHSEYAVSDVLHAYAAFKPRDLSEVLHKHLKESDIIIRGTAAELLGELPPDETNTRALIEALPVALADKELNDAALAILDSLAKQKSSVANDAIKTALNSQDYLVRRKAVAVLKANGAGDFSSRIGIVHTRNTTADYERAISRIGKHVRAVVTTSKGSFTIELLPEDAPLNVDNFIQLTKRHYFNGIPVHRVVPNFVIQDGDPRGDGNGGPGYQIRCEINQMPYERGAVGMALSGKDTGGSQWFVTHSPQPHLDGGYTIFGRVASNMAVVDRIVRGDVIRSIIIKESSRHSAKR